MTKERRIEIHCLNCGFNFAVDSIEGKITCPSCGDEFRVSQGGD